MFAPIFHNPPNLEYRFRVPISDFSDNFLLYKHCPDNYEHNSKINQLDWSN